MTRITEQFVKLACSVCKRANYRIRKNKRLHKEKLSLKKHCPHCRKHTLHNEAK
ncbi:MAG: 50S ribosomal protein L33 [Candidatus Moraniibacteriota bacterium]